MFFIKYKISVCFLGIACVFYKNKMIIIQGQVGTMNEKISEKTLLERFEKFKPVFNYVANSLMLSNLYKQRRIK